MLERLLADRDWLLADGAIATNLFELGLPLGQAPERWLIEYPERVINLHRSFIAAGADIILTNTFGGNRMRLARHSPHADPHVLNRIGAELAHAAAAARPVVIAGCVGPTGERLAPHGPLTEAEAVAIFVEQMHGLKDGGAHVLWLETMSGLAEMRAAATAANHVGLGCVVTASFDTAGCTRLGDNPEALVEDWATWAPKPLAIGSNCGAGPADLVASILAITSADPHAIVVAKANCGMPRVLGERLIYDVTIERMQDYARLARDAGARIIGGCCGTTPAHVAAMRHALLANRRGERPTLDRVAAILGPLSGPQPNTPLLAGR